MSEITNPEVDIVDVSQKKQKQELIEQPPKYDPEKDLNRKKKTGPRLNEVPDEPNAPHLNS